MALLGSINIWFRLRFRLFCVWEIYTFNIMYSQLLIRISKWKYFHPYVTFNSFFIKICKAYKFISFSIKIFYRNLKFIYYHFFFSSVKSLDRIFINISSSTSIKFSSSYFLSFLSSFSLSLLSPALTFAPLKS